MKGLFAPGLTVPSLFDEAMSPLASFAVELDPGPPVGPSYVYIGAAGWPAYYKGPSSDATLYKGARTLHP